MKNLLNIKNKKQNINSTRISIVGSIANKLGANKKFHRFCDDPMDYDSRFIVSPVDAKCVAQGKIIKGGKIISKSNKEISLNEIIGDKAELFSGGFYLNLYLSPKNRHYWRMPYGGILSSMHIHNGKAWIPVLIGLDKIFKNKDYFKKAIKKNANIGLVFNSDKFPFVMIPVGSLNVNGIHIVNENNNVYKKGDIGGYFSIGSSMLLCFPKSNFETLISIGDKVKIGQNIIKIN